MDIDSDGYIDLLSGSWPGELFLFRGGSGRTFEKPVMIKDREGHDINVGGGIRDSNPDGMLLIAGNAEFKTDEKGEQYVEYQGKRIDTKDRQVGITGTASAVHAFDWDADGDLDLLVGDIQGDVHLVPNEGTAKAYTFGKDEPLRHQGKPASLREGLQQLIKPGARPFAGEGTPIRVAGDAGPYVADWDADGKPDLLVGAGDGSVSWFRNVGEPGKPVLEAAVLLVKPTRMDYANPSEQAEPGMRTKLCVADWTGDGRPDLLVGDVCYQKPKAPELTPEDRKKQEALKAELAKVREEYSGLTSKLFSSRTPVPAEERKKLEEEMRPVIERMSKLQQELPPEVEYHGWVWLYARKPQSE